MRITILGCGSSEGVPVLGYGWGDCDKNNPKNFRTRSSIIIKTEETSLLIDMSPDLRQQLLLYDSCNVDAVIFTHTHYDHVSGINELRSVFREQNKLLPVYGTLRDITEIKKKHAYLFERTGHKFYKPYLESHIIEDKFTIGDISGLCFDQNHGFSQSLGIRIGNFAYSTDVVSLSEDNFRFLYGVDTWIVDCVSIKNATQTHAHLDLVLEWEKEIKPRRVFLTHMGITMDYDTLLHILPENIKPSYDQMEITVDR
ncbi:MAG: MBL fold metallo-hydrolase [Holosporaceae bacterium]|jgi:phosphoribosyl 1,2-cyclic phosphate phosphodiesterase|nr:MBL fold metallo-hydrolase [Holosporaceae bacterium]